MLLRVAKDVDNHRDEADNRAVMVDQFSGFLELPFATSACGVYLLLLRGRVVYVGKSLNLPGRIAQHINRQIKLNRGALPKLYGEIAPVRFDQIFVRAVRRDLLDKEELELIQQYLPQNNVLMKRIPTLKLRLEDLPSWRRVREARDRPLQVYRRKLPTHVLPQIDLR